MCLKINPQNINQVSTLIKDRTSHRILSLRDNHENPNIRIQLAGGAENNLSRRESCWRRNQTTVMRICDRWMQEGTTDRRGRSHPSQYTTSREDRQIVRMAQSGLFARRPLPGLPLTQNHRRLRHQWCDERRMWAAEWNEVVFTDESRICLQHHDGRIRVWRHRGERMLNSCVMLRTIGPAPGIMVWGGIGYHSRTPLVRIAGTLNSQRYISEVLEPVVLSYLLGLDTAIFQQDNARTHVARIVQRFFVNHQIELLLWPAHSPDLSPIENMWSMVAQGLT
ncbi:transposable element Tc3 transposase [Trichonephila clavipes]|nr:transposable element Tc3 transposase [Trichonephila clavipes]